MKGGIVARVGGWSWQVGTGPLGSATLTFWVQSDLCPTGFSSQHCRNKDDKGNRAGHSAPSSGRWRQEDREFKAGLCDVASSCSAWATRNPVWKKSTAGWWGEPDVESLSSTEGGFHS